VVVAEPAALVVERDREEVGAVEGGEPGGAPGETGDGIAKWPREPFENRGSQEERLGLAVLGSEHLFAEVIEHEPVRAAEGSHEPIGLGGAARGQRRQLQGGGPAFGARFECLDLSGAEAELLHAVEELVRFVHGEAQIVGADFEEAAAGSQPCERERGIAPAPDDQVHVRGHVFEQGGQRRVDPRGFDEVVVVEDEHRGPIERADVVRNPDRKPFQLRIRAGGHGPGPARGLGEIAREVAGIAISLVEGKPGDGGGWCEPFVPGEHQR